MRIEFRKLTVENFGSFLAAQTLDLAALEIGVHFIAGDNRVDKGLGENGAGKSTLVNALCWCLYGQTTDGLKAKDLKPWKGRGKPTVTVLAKFDGVRHKIKRTAPNAIELDGKEVGQQAIDDLMHMGFIVFKQAVLFGQRKPLFYDLPNRQKMELLVEVMQLYKWDQRSQAASDRVRELEATDTELKSDYEVATHRLADCRSRLKTAVADADGWEADLAKRLKTYKADKKRYEADQAKAQEKQDLAYHLGITAAEKLGAAQAEMAIAKEQLAGLEQKTARINDRRDEVSRQVQALEKQLAAAQGVKRCPTCGQAVNSKEDLAEHRKEIKAQLEVLNGRLKSLAIPDTKLLADLKHTYIVAHGKEVNYQTEVNHHKREVDAATGQLAECKARLEALERFRTEREKEVNPYHSTIKQLKSLRAELKVELETLEAERAKMARLSERAKFWIKGFKDIRLLKVEEALQELEITTNNLLEEMGLVDWQVSYAVERATQAGTIQTGMVVSINSPHNAKPVKWECWSGGEGQRLRLAGALALSEVLLAHAGIEIDLEVLDEPTASLSDKGVSDLGEMLAARAELVERKILYIDHAAYEGSQFASTITVRKTKEGSQIVGM